MDSDDRGGQLGDENDSFSFSGEETELFDSMMSTVDVNEATKTCFS